MASVKARQSSVSHTLRGAWRASRGGLLAILVFSGFTNLLKFAMPLYLLQVLDRVPESRSVETLVMLTIAASIAVLTAVAIDHVRQRLLSRWGIWIEEQFGARLFQRAATAGEVGETAALRQPLDNLTKIRSFVTRSATSWLDVVWAPVFLVGVYLVHPWLGLLSLGSIAVLLLLGVLQEALTREGRRASRSAASEAEEIVSATERNLESVAALSMSPNLAERWRRGTAARLGERARSDGRAAVFAALITGLGHCTKIAMLACGIWLMLRGEMTLGGVFAARVMMGFGYRLVEKAVRNWRALLDAGAAYASVKRRLAEGEGTAASTGSATPDAALVLDSVGFRYTGQRDHVLRRLDFSARPGDLVLVVGPAAAGKTTLSRLLVGMLSPRYGQVRLGDVEVGRLPAEMRARLIGYLPQDTQLFRATVRENIARMGESDFDDVVAASKLANIHEIVMRLPQGYDTEISEEATGLSGSERKRIGLARAVYGMPRLLVLDEPAANLDRASRKALEAAIATLKQAGSTVVVTTQAGQDTRLGRLADKVLILGGGSHQITDQEDAPAKNESDENTGPIHGLRPVT